jgi:hypothetical protein
MSDDNKPYNILVPREYTTGNGEVKTRYHDAGVAFKTKGGQGFSCEVVPGMALTGRFLILPRTDRDTAEGNGE